MFRLVIREFRLIFSDSGAMLLLLFAMLIYATIYSIAYGAEVVESVSIAVVDEDNTTSSRDIVAGLREGAEVTVPSEKMSDVVNRLWTTLGYLEDVAVAIDSLSPTKEVLGEALS